MALKKEKRKLILKPTATITDIGEVLSGKISDGKFEFNCKYIQLNPKERLIHVNGQFYIESPFDLNLLTLAEATKRGWGDLFVYG